MTPLLVELPGGLHKPLEDCSDIERVQGLRISEQKRELAARWTTLIGELGEDAWIPRTPLIQKMGPARERVTVSLAELQEDIPKLEAVLEMKKRGTGSVN